MIALRALGHLMLRTVQEPRIVGVDLVALGLGREVLWLGMALATVLNALLFTLTRMIAPSAVPLPAYAASPVILVLFLVCGLVVTVFAILWTGRALGGQGGLPGVLVLVTWLQFMRAAVQALVLVLMPFSAGLAAVAALVAGMLALWILINFVAAVHGFDGLGRAVLVLVLAVGLLALGLAMMLSLIGATKVGVAGYV